VVSNAGSGGFGGVSGNATGGPEFREDDEDELATDPVISAAPAPSGAASVSSTSPNILGAAGLNHRDNRTADNGNQFSLEPPDQGLCVGNGYVVEAVNLVVGLRSAATNTRIGAVTSLNKFFGLPSAIDRTNIIFGPFLSDPKCLYDNDTKRFFLTILELDTNPANGGFTGPSAVLIAVSKTSNPLDGFQIFNLKTTNDGTNGTPSHPDCPCYGDQPLIGMDDNGLYISTNEFSVFEDGFNGAQIYGISKQKLAAAASSGSTTPIPAAHVNAGAIPVPPADAAVGGVWYTVQPAVTPPNKPGNDGNSNKLKGIQYFLSALEFAGVPDNRVAVWALTNTNSLQSAAPNVQLSLDIVNTATAYISPPRSTQKPSAATPAPRPIDGGDDRMQQVVMVDNTLYGSLTTAIGTGATARSGIAYWGIKPSWPGGTLKGSVRVEGMVSVDNNFLQRPSVALNHQGNGVIAFSLIGPDYFPSAAYIGFDKQQGAQGSVYVAGAGVAPDTGFSGAAGGRQRWGDYSAGVDEAGNIWVAAEYIPVVTFGAAAQGGSANWGTFVWRVIP